MRGRNIIWLSLIAVLLGAMTVNMGASAANTKLYIDPTRVPEPGLEGSVGDQYTISVRIQDVDDLWGVGFTVHFAPYVSVVTVSQIFEGPFLATGWEPYPNPPTSFAYTIDSFAGDVYIAIVRLPDPMDPDTRWGASGSGLIATFVLTVIEAGESPLDIENSQLLDSNGNPIAHKATGSFYYGPTASVVRVNMLPGRSVQVGEEITLNLKVRNDGTVPLYVTVLVDLERLEDGRRIQVRSGQTYFGGGLGEPAPAEYIYVDEFDEMYFEWDGDPENLFGTPDGSYIESDTNAAWACLYSFEAITDPWGLPISDIFLQGYTQYPQGPTDDVDIDMYDITPAQGYPFAWWGSLYGAAAWGWVNPRWTTDSVLTSSPWLSDKDALNDVWILAYNYHGSADHIMRVDSLRLRVDYATIVPVLWNVEQVVMPGEELDLEPIIWPTIANHIGSYRATAQIEYTIEGLKWNYWGSAEKTFAFKIVP